MSATVPYPLTPESGMSLIRHLKDTEPFNHLPEEIFQEISTAASVRKYPANHHIFHQNDPPTGYLYVIKEGLVEIVVTTPGGSGNPSSETVPSRRARSGRVTVWSSPASTLGAWLAVSVT